MLTFSTVKRLPQADLVLALNQDGKIVEQGDFAKLNVPGTYIHTLQVKVHDEEASHQDRGDVVEDAVTNSQTHLLSAEAVADDSRKTGDWATYKYYARALGPWGMFMFVALVAGNETFVGMASKCS